MISIQRFHDKRRQFTRDKKKGSDHILRTYSSISRRRREEGGGRRGEGREANTPRQFPPRSPPLLPNSINGAVACQVQTNNNNSSSSRSKDEGGSKPSCSKSQLHSSRGSKPLDRENFEATLNERTQQYLRGGSSCSLQLKVIHRPRM